ncbi:MAG: efflux RND transporter periplasmic adaptor subunit [Planctomycetes bacterium]|nr:efflux RND transporter periplasmic adaptor subunit [Planctomycetota bacterium]
MTMHRALHHLPTALSIIALVAIGWWGHHTGWRAPTLAHVQGDVGAGKTADWCDEHGVSESRCILCKTSLLDQLIGPGAAKATSSDGVKVGYAQFASGDAVTKAGVTTITVERRSIAEQITLPGETDFDQAQVSRIVARSPARVARVLVSPGDAVKAGQPVLLLDAADVGRAKSELLRALAAFRMTSATRERVAASAQAGLRTRTEVAEADAAAQQGQIAVFDAEQALNNLGLVVSGTDLAKLEPQQLAEHVRLLGIPEELRSETTTANILPVTTATDGMVTDVTTVAGAAVESGSPLVVVAAQDQMWLMMNTSPQQAASIAPGQAVAFIADSLEGPVTGTVSWVSSAIDQATRTVPVRARLPNQQGRLRAHLYGKVMVTVRNADHAVVIPASAVQFDGPTPIAFIRRTDDIFEARPLVLGARADGVVEVKSGLTGDETIAITGTEAVKAALYKDRLGAGCADD